MRNQMKLALICVLSVVMVSLNGINAMADETVITLDSGAATFSKVEQDLDFRDMEPGEERTAVISFVNSAEEDMNFYLNGEIVYNIADAAKNSKNAVYELTLTKDNEAEPFFTGIFGSEDNSKVENNHLIQYLSQDTILAVLKKDESTRISLTLSLDGDSTENEYMNAAGIIRFHVGTSLRTEVAADEDVIPIIKYIQVVTGDRNPVRMLMLAGIISMFVIFGILYKGRKNTRVSYLKKTGNKMLLLLMMASALSASCPKTALAAGGRYQAEFRAGSHGSFGFASKVTVQADYQTALQYIPEPDKVDEGYWFTGYSPMVSERVTENAVYVAQYARLVNAVEYRISFIDGEGNAIATQKVAYANIGDDIVAYAPPIEGYQPDAMMKSRAAVSMESNEITFVYTPRNNGEAAADEDALNPEIIYVYEYINGESDSGTNNRVVDSISQDGAVNANGAQMETTASEEGTAAGIIPEVAADEEETKAEIAANEDVLAVKNRKKSVQALVWICVAAAICGACTMVGIGVTEIIKIKKNKVKKDK